MQRRGLLATLAATASGGFAGCGAGGSNSPTRTPSTCDDHVPRRIDRTGAGSVADPADLSIAATVERARSTPTAPATLAVTITNEGDARAIDVTDGPRCHVFERDSGLSDPRGLWLYRAGDTPDDRAGECWMRAATPPERVGFDGYACGQYLVATGDSVTTVYEVWDDYATDGYFETGTYRFETDVSVYSNGDADDPVRSIDWWLEISVSTVRS